MSRYTCWVTGCDYAADNGYDAANHPAHPPFPTRTELTEAIRVIRAEGVQAFLADPVTRERLALMVANEVRWTVARVEQPQPYHYAKADAILAVLRSEPA